MTLRKKAFIIITLTTLLLIAVVLLLSNRMIMGSFGRLEEQQIHQNAQQAIRLLADEVAKLESTLMDWANWDDTYQFVTDANAGYIENNLNEASIVNLNLNFMFFTDIAGHIVHSVGVDPESGRIGPVPSALRETDVVARMGGDEFTILLTNPERSSPCAVVQRIAMALSQPFDINGQAIDFVSASVGAKRFSADAETAEKLVKAADSDMYQVKNKRKHSHICAMIKEHQQADVA